VLIYNNQLLQASFTASSVMPGKVVVTGIKAVDIPAQPRGWLQLKCTGSARRSHHFPSAPTSPTVTVQHRRIIIDLICLAPVQSGKRKTK
jgi:hypothetical protein